MNNYYPLSSEDLDVSSNAKTFLEQQQRQAWLRAQKNLDDWFEFPLPPELTTPERSREAQTLVATGLSLLLSHLPIEPGVSRGTNVRINEDHTISFRLSRCIPAPLSD
jgi:hypothetical protein